MKPNPAHRLPTLVATLLAWLALPAAASATEGTALDWAESPHPPGQRGGQLVVSLRAEPRTLDPMRAQDESSRAVAWALHADLLRIDRATLEVVPGLAKGWTRSADGRRFELELRRGLRFSDGRPCDADDVVASFARVLDPATGAPQRALLLLDGKPPTIEKLDPHRVRITLAKPYAAAERLFDGFAILPRALPAAAAGLEGAAFPGLGPYRLRERTPGARLVLERNPHYWQRDARGTALPYLDEVLFVVTPSEEAETLRLGQGEVHLTTRLAHAAFARLEQAERLRALDLGPGFESHFLFFNLNAAPTASPELQRRQRWFREPRFRQAIDRAVDRAALVRLVFGGRAEALASAAAPGNPAWRRRAPAGAPPDLAHARRLLTEAGFRWDADGRLLDTDGARVAFSLATTAGHRQREAMGAILAEDLRPLGITVTVAPLEPRALLERVLSRFDYDACLLGFALSDADPNPEIAVWTSSGASQLWSIVDPEPLPAWQQEIDRLMAAQLAELDPTTRRSQFHRVQQLLEEHLPVIPLVSPHVLLAVPPRLGGLRPSRLPPYAFWNLAELHWQPAPGEGGR